MKRIGVLILAGVCALLAGCSLLEETNDTLTYVNQANDYISQASSFAEEAPALIEEAATDPQAGEELQNTLQSIKEEAASFNKLEAPGVVSDLHDQLVEQNNRLTAGINEWQNRIEDGTLNVSELENSEIFQSIQQITSIYNQIEELTGES
ncbi:hypothetical protein EWH99_03310 [Sporolactobacillus sp. THM7-7]|nr:hypothetical protein EWH99_03310 [Sporolactobacillus sp. THM7-7]